MNEHLLYESRAYVLQTCKKIGRTTPKPGNEEPCLNRNESLYCVFAVRVLQHASSFAFWCLLVSGSMTHVLSVARGVAVRASAWARAPAVWSRPLAARWLSDSAPPPMVYEVCICCTRVQLFFVLSQCFCATSIKTVCCVTRHACGERVNSARRT